jgi:membrane protein
MLAKLRSAIANFARHECPQMAAAIAYYMVFALPALLLISVTVASYVAKSGALGDEGVVRERILRATEKAIGPISAENVDKLIENSRHSRPTLLHAVAGVALLLVSASGVMMQLQLSLNTIWHVDLDTHRFRNRGFLLKRMVSFASVVAIGLLLLISVVLSTLLATLGEFMQHVVPDSRLVHTPKILGAITDLVVSFLMFTGIYRWLPDARIRWRFALRGGLITAGMFVVGKTLLAYYLSRLHIGSAYGVAGSLVLLLAWFYYNALVFLLGAEITYALRTGKPSDDICE